MECWRRDGQGVDGDRAVRAADQRVHVQGLEVVAQLHGERGQAGDRPERRRRGRPGARPGRRPAAADPQAGEQLGGQRARPPAAAPRRGRPAARPARRPRRPRSAGRGRGRGRGPGPARCPAGAVSQTSTRGPEPGGQVGVGRRPAAPGSARPEHHAADVGLVRDAGLVGLEHDRVAERLGGGERPGLVGWRGRAATAGCRTRAAGPAAARRRSCPAASSSRAALPPVAAGQRGGQRLAGRRCGPGGRPGQRGGVVEQVAQREQAGAGALQHRDAVLAQPAGDSGSMALPRLLSTASGLSVRAAASSSGQRVGLSPSLVDQVDGQRDRGHRRVVGQRGQRARRTARGCRRRCPRRRAGWSAPGRGRAARASRVRGRRRRSRRTARRARSARSATCARSAPESCTVAIPAPGAGRAAGRAGRPIANSSRVSASSARSPTRCTPYASASASQPPSPPASAPECAATIAWPAGRAADGQQHDRDVPLGRAGQHGRAARRRRAWPRAPARAPGSRAGRARSPGRPASVVTSSWPEDTARVKPSRAVGAQQRGEHRAGVRDQRDRPGGQRVGARCSRSPAGPRLTLTKPMQPAPHSAIPAPLAIAASRSRRRAELPAAGS